MLNSCKKLVEIVQFIMKFDRQFFPNWTPKKKIRKLEKGKKIEIEKSFL